MYIPDLGNLFGFGSTPQAGGTEWAKLLGLGALGDLGFDPFGLQGEDPTSAAARSSVEAEMADRAAARAQAEGATRAAMGTVGGRADAAALELQRRTGAGLAGLEQAYGSAAGEIGAGDQASLAALARGYGSGAQALGQGYAGARGVLSGLGATDTTGALGGLRGAELGAGYQPSPGLAFAQEQARNATLARASAMGGRGGGSTLMGLSSQAQGLAGQDYQDYAQRALGLRQTQLGAMGEQAGRSDAAALARAQGLANVGSRYGQGLAGLYGQQGEAMAAQQQAISGGLAGLLQAYGQNQLGYQTGLGSQLANTYTTTGSNIASALTGTGQLSAGLSTGINRAPIVATVGGAQAATQGGVRDLMQLAMLSYLQGGR